jgi:hypothetical protein
MDRVVTPRMEGVAPEDATGAPVESRVERQRAERLLRILGAARMEPAGARQEWREEKAVAPDQDEEHGGDGLHLASFVRSRFISTDT